MITQIATAPPIIAVVLLEEEAVLWVVLLGGLHSSLLRDKVATEQSVSTVSSTPVTMVLAPLFTHSSVGEIREPLCVFVSKSQKGIFWGIFAAFITYMHVQFVVGREWVLVNSPTLFLKGVSVNVHTYHQVQFQQCY